MAGDGAADDRVSAEIEVRIGPSSNRKYWTIKYEFHLLLGEYLSLTTIDFDDKVCHQQQ